MNYYLAFILIANAINIWSFKNIDFLEYLDKQPTKLAVDCEPKVKDNDGKIADKPNLAGVDQFYCPRPKNQLDSLILKSNLADEKSKAKKEAKISKSKCYKQKASSSQVKLNEAKSIQAETNEAKSSQS